MREILAQLYRLFGILSRALGPSGSAQPPQPLCRAGCEFMVARRRRHPLHLEAQSRSGKAVSRRMLRAEHRQPREKATLQVCNLATWPRSPAPGSSRPRSLGPLRRRLSLPGRPSCRQPSRDRLHLFHVAANTPLAPDRRVNATTGAITTKSTRSSSGNTRLSKKTTRSGLFSPAASSRRLSTRTGAHPGRTPAPPKRNSTALQASCRHCIRSQAELRSRCPRRRRTPRLTPTTPPTSPPPGSSRRRIRSDA